MSAAAPLTPDVTVVVAVYNTMPYLTRCLSSLVEQTLAERRMEVVIVDDGSTDGSAEEIERFAQRHPVLFTVLHQPNSGGPGAPSNRGLELAAGRYVFFLGADDHLAPDALERMVAAADTYGSDVLLCKMAAVGERKVPTVAFTRNAPAIRLVGDGLPWALSNTKLFRRAMVERHRMRYPEDMPAFSDQPFVLEACFRARRISVLADQDYYFAVRRTDSSNITFQTDHEVRLRCASRLFETTTRFLDPGPLRTGFHRRHFHVELFQLFDAAFLNLAPGVRDRVVTGAAALITRYDDGVLQLLDERRRRTLELVRRGATDALCEEIRADLERAPARPPETRSTPRPSRPRRRSPRTAAARTGVGVTLKRWLLAPVPSGRPGSDRTAARPD